MAGHIAKWGTMGGQAQKKIAKTVAGQTKFGIWEGRCAGIQDITGGENGLIGEHIHTCGIMVTTMVIIVMVVHYIGISKEVALEPQEFNPVVFLENVS